MTTQVRRTPRPRRTSTTTAPRSGPVLGPGLGTTLGTTLGTRLGAGLALVILLAACNAGPTYSSAPGTSAVPGSTAAGSSAAGSGPIVHTAKTVSGTVLVNADGRTMYAFAADSPGHSTCSGACLQYWPPVVVGTDPIRSPADITATLGVLPRPDGTKQLTVNGWPMYLYSGGRNA